MNGCKFFFERLDVAEAKKIVQTTGEFFECTVRVVGTARIFSNAWQEPFEWQEIFSNARQEPFKWQEFFGTHGKTRSSSKNFFKHPVRVVRTAVQSVQTADKRWERFWVRGHICCTLDAHTRHILCTNCWCQDTL